MEITTVELEKTLENISDAMLIAFANKEDVIVPNCYIKDFINFIKQNTTEDLRLAEDGGYSDGNEEGYEEGYEDGDRNGYERGYEEGFEAGLQSAYDELSK